MKDFAEKFNSLEEFSNAINSRPLNKQWSGDRAQESKTEEERRKRKKFYHTADYATATNLMIEGDAANLDKINRVNVGAVRGENAARTQYRTGVVGCLPCVPNYLRGVPNNMIQARKEQAPGKIINLIYNISTPCNTTPATIIERGAKVATLVNSLELAGIRVALWAAEKSYSDGQLVSLYVCIKRAAAPLNKLQIAYPLINPSFLRRHCFRWLETIPAEIERFTGYGYTRRIENGNAEIAALVGGQYVAINGTEIDSLTAENIAEKYIK